MTHPSLEVSPETLLEDIATIFERCAPLFETASQTRRYTIAGRSFAAMSDLDPYLNAVDVAVASHAPSQDRGARIFIGVAGQNGCPTLHWNAPHFEERQIEALLAPTRYRMHYFHPLKYWQIFDRQTSTGLQIMTGPDQHPAWDLGSPLRNFIQWELASYGGALIHAGTLAMGEKGVLLAGAGGSGKSGTVLSGMLSGLQTVGDDYVYVKPKSLQAFALFNTLKQDDTGVRRLGLLGHKALPTQTNWQDKYQFYINDLGLAPQPKSIALHALLLPKIGQNAKTTTAEISAKQAFLALAPSGVSQIPGDRALLYAAAAEVSRNLPCFQLSLGPDPREVSDTIRQFIEDI